PPRPGAAPGQSGTAPCGWPPACSSPCRTSSSSPAPSRRWWRCRTAAGRRRGGALRNGVPGYQGQDVGAGHDAGALLLQRRLGGVDDVEAVEALVRHRVLLRRPARRRRVDGVAHDGLGVPARLPVVADLELVAGGHGRAGGQHDDRDGAERQELHELPLLH
uniref:Uncharacterized protein n=1 Tax=Oryza brachyantha TaxID=4533 RepID=J3MLJ8_ORYBR